MGPVAVAVLVALLAYCIYWLRRFYLFVSRVRQHGYHIDKLPGPKRHWSGLIGHFYDFPGLNEQGLEYLRRKAQEYPRLFQLWYSPVLPAVAVVHPDTVKVILKSSEPKAKVSGPYRFMIPWLGDGLLLSDGKKWHRNRRLLTPAFHFDVLQPYMEVYNRASDIFLSKVLTFAQDDKPFDVFEHTALLTLDILLQCAFSHESGCQISGENHPFVKSVIELAESLSHRTISPWLYPDFIYYLTPGGRKFQKNCDFVHSFSTEVIQSRKIRNFTGQIPLTKGKYLDFLDILLTARDVEGHGLTDGEIRDEVDTFLFGGHDTTASGISWCLYSLAAHPEHQAKCQEEIDEVLQGRDSDEITWDDLPKLKYLNMCIKESMRLHTPVVSIYRELTKDTTVDGFFVPTGTLVELQLYMLHHNPTVWHNPTQFTPQRFSPENLEKMDSFAFIPFSAGPRNCIGQNFAKNELKLVIARILRGFELTVDADHVVRHKIAVIMKAEGGIWLTAKPR